MIKIINLVFTKNSFLISFSFIINILERRQNEGSFGCEAVARVLGQPNVPEYVSAIFIFLLCLYAAKIPFLLCHCLFSSACL